MSSGNLILIAVMYIFAIGISFPISLKGTRSSSCDLQVNYQFHLVYLAIVAIALIPSDIYSYINNGKIRKIIQQ